MDPYMMESRGAQSIADHCDKRMEKIHRCLRKIIEHSEDGQNGSAVYALDRLARIKEVAEIALKK